MISSERLLIYFKNIIEGCVIFLYIFILYKYNGYFLTMFLEILIDGLDLESRNYSGEDLLLLYPYLI